MKGFLTSRSEIEIFGRITEKEDIVPVEFTQENDQVSFEIKKSEFIYRLMQKSRVFAINTPKWPSPKEEDICEMNEGEFIDKFKLCDFEKEECGSIDCPRIKKYTTLECELVKEQPSKNGIIITGKVLTTKTP